MYYHGSGAAIYSTTIHLTCCLPFACPSSLPSCTEAAPMTVQESVLSLSSPASPDALAEHLFGESEHRTRAPTVSYALDRAMQHSKEARRRLRLDHAILLDHPHQCRPPSTCRAIPDHRSRWRSRRSHSKLSHHRQPPHSTEVEGTTTSMRMLGGPISLDLTHSSQCPELTLSAY